MSETGSNTVTWSPPVIETELVSDLVCHLCGRTAGTIRSQIGASPAKTRFTPTGAQQPIALPNWRRLRCAQCGGSLFVQDLRRVQRRVESPDIWEPQRRRIGRPPKWLVEQRRRERELSEEQQAA
jgi:hypothetical protein